MMAAFSSTFRPGIFLREPRYSNYYSDGDEDLFVDCVDKQLDVFDVLEIERDDTSVSLSSSSSSSSNSLELSDDISYYSSGSTVYLDALDVSLSDDDESEFTDRDLPLESILSILQVMDQPTESMLERTERFKDHQQEKNETIVDQECKEENPITHAIHFAQNLWEGSKHTPVGFAVHLTEDVVGGVLGHLVRLVQHDEDMKPTVEQQLAPFSRDYPSGQHVVFTLDIPAENGGTDISSYVPSDEEDWLPLE